MKNYKGILDDIANIEHEQWTAWSQAIAHDLRRILQYAKEKDFEKIELTITGRLERWQKLWKPFRQLKTEAKDQDREWAEKVIPLVPIRCPVYQCGGFMQARERKPPLGFLDWESYDGDEQTPDMVCTNCRAIYQYKGFKRKRDVHKG